MAASIFCGGVTQAAVIGYYNLGNPGDISAEASIIQAGHTGVQLAGLSSADLTGIDVLWVLNPSNWDYAVELTSNVASIEAYVQNGGGLMFHDRYVTDAAAVIPGAGSVTLLRDFTDGASIELAPGATGTLLSGPGGIVDATTLDGGSSSSHGYAVASTLPAGSVVVLTRTDSTEVVDFYYSLGGGTVYYSTIPLDFYLSGAGAKAPDFQTYAANLAAYIFEIIGPSLSPIQFQHIAMADSARYDTQLLQKHIEAARKGFFADGAYHYIERGEDGTSEAFRSWDSAALVGYTDMAKKTFGWGVALTLHNAGNKSSMDSGVQGEYSAYGMKGYGRYQLPAFMGLSSWVDLVGGISYLDDVELQRGDASGDTDGYQYDLGIRFGSAIPVEDAMVIRPTIGLEYISTHLEDYDESGVGAMSYDELDSHATFAVLGCIFDFATVETETLKLRSSIALEYRRRLHQQLDDIDATLVATPTSTSAIELFDYNEDLGKFEVAFGVDYDIVSIDLLGSYYTGDNDTNGTSVSLAVTVPF